MPKTHEVLLGLAEYISSLAQQAENRAVRSANAGTMYSEGFHMGQANAYTHIATLLQQLAGGIRSTV
jgi:hypothetical protein